ncbi:MAG: SRPBCC family protein [Actinomycetes bacterium]
MFEQRVSATRTVPAPPEKVFALLRDPSMHSVIDGGGHVTGSRTKAAELSLGDKFTTSNRMFLPYLITNKVVEFETDRLIAWCHIGGWRWRYELEPADDGASTVVTETFDWSTAKSTQYVELLGWPKRNEANLHATLERLAAYFEHRADL